MKKTGKELKQELLTDNQKTTSFFKGHKNNANNNEDIGECHCINNCLKYTFFIIFEIIGIIFMLFGTAYGGNKEGKYLGLFYGLFITGTLITFFTSLFICSMKAQIYLLKTDKLHMITMGIFGFMYIMALILGGAVKTVWASFPFSFLTTASLIFRNLLFMEIFKMWIQNCKEGIKKRKENKKAAKQQKTSGSTLIFDELPY